jgi:hypothetical protein
MIGFCEGILPSRLSSAILNAWPFHAGLLRRGVCHSHCGTPAGEEVENQKDYGCNEHDVNKTRRNVKREKAE